MEMTSSPLAYHYQRGTNSAILLNRPSNVWCFDASRDIQSGAQPVSAGSSTPTRDAVVAGTSKSLAKDPTSPSVFTVIACPQNLDARHPRSWSKDEVEEWLEWCVEEFSLGDVQLRRFSMNGKALCLLNKDGFQHRAPYAGDVLHDLLQKLLKRESSVKQGTQQTGFVYTSPLRCRNNYSNHYLKPADVEEKPTMPELLPLNLKITNGSTESVSNIVEETGHETCRDSGRGSPHGPFKEEMQTAHPLSALQYGYPSRLIHYSRVQHKPEPLPKNREAERGFNHETPKTAAQDGHFSHPPTRNVSPLDPFNRNVPHTHSPGSNLTSYADLSGNSTPHHYTPGCNPPLHQLPSSLPHCEGHTGAECAIAIEDCNPNRKHGRDMGHAYYDCKDGPVLREILTGVRHHSPVPSYNHLTHHDDGISALHGKTTSQMEVHSKVHVPVIQEASAAATNCESFSRVITSCSANRKPATISCDSFARATSPIQKDTPRAASLLPVSCHYSYCHAPSVGQKVAYHGDFASSVLSSFCDVQGPRYPKMHTATSEAACKVKQVVRACSQKGSRKLLWHYLWQLLLDDHYLQVLRWEDIEKRVFRIIDTEAVANLWGQQKNRKNMTYEKLSRGLRYYYRTNILCKELGQKLTYRFLKDPKDIAKSPRFSKVKKTKAEASTDARSTEGSVCQYHPNSSSCSEKDEDSSEEMILETGTIAPESMDGETLPVCCGSPIVMATVAKESTEIKKHGHCT